VNGTDAAARRMRTWAENNPHCDTQGIQEDEWHGLARAALDLPYWVCPNCGSDYDQPGTCAEERCEAPLQRVESNGMRIVAKLTDDGWQPQ
jgi:hypothetical protein